jgi:hypothetical protein
MKTYWDLSEPERAALSRDEVERYGDAELMTAGVLKPTPAQIVAVSVPPVTTKTYFTLSTTGRYGATTCDVAFESREIAEEHLKHAVHVDNDYDLGSNVAHPVYGPAKSVDAVPEHEAARHRSAILEAKAAKEANEKEATRVSRERELAERALAGMWTDWHERREQDKAMRRVVDVYRSYVTTADGDAAVALKFLRKAFPDDTIRSAGEWCGEPALIASPVDKAVEEPAVH